MTSLSVSELSIKSAVSIELIDLSGAPDLYFHYAANSIALWQSTQTGETLEDSVDEIKLVQALLDVSGFFNTEEFVNLAELALTTTDVEALDNAQNAFVQFVKDTIAPKVQEDSAE